MRTATPTTFRLLDPRRPPECWACEGTGELDVDLTPGCPVTERVDCADCGGLGFREEPECRECCAPAQVEIRDDEQQFACLVHLHEFVPHDCTVPDGIAALMPAEPTDEQLAEMQALR